MLTYYRDRTVEVTSIAIRINGKVFTLTDLDYVWHVQVEADRSMRGRVARRGALNIGVVVAIILAVLGIVFLVTAAMTNPVTAAAVLIPLAVVVLLVALAGPLLEWLLHRLDRSYDLGTKVHEIWAAMQGKEIVLLRIADETRFGKIYRSIERALENQG